MRREAGVRRAFIVGALLLGGWALAPAAPGPAAGLAGTAVLSDSCPTPNLSVRGVEWRDGDLWTVSGDGTLTHLAGCTPIAVVSVNAFRGLATGLGWDTQRNLWVVADVKLGEIDVVDVKGNVVHTFPAPGTGPAGVGYDARRDAIWISDSQTDQLYAISAATGVVIKQFPLPGHQLWAGAAYDSSLDAVYVHDRVLDPGLTCSYFSAATGQLMGSFTMPYPSLSGYNDNAIDASGRLWADNDARSKVYCFTRETTPVRSSNWGQLKSRYRER